MTVPAIASLPKFPTPGEPRYGVEQPALVLLTAAVAAIGGPVWFVRPHSRVSMQVSFDTGGASVKVFLQGTIDGVNWFTLGTFDTGASGASGDIVTSSSHVLAGARAVVDTLSVGTVSVVLLAGQYNGG